MVLAQTYYLSWEPHLPDERAPSLATCLLKQFQKARSFCVTCKAAKNTFFVQIYMMKNNKPIGCIASNFVQSVS